MKALSWVLSFFTLALLGFGLGRWRSSSPLARPSVVITPKTDRVATPEIKPADPASPFSMEEATPEKISSELRRLGPYAPLSALENLFKRWAETDPSAACAFFKTFGLPDEKAHTLSKVLLQAWQKLDPATAAAFALSEIDATETLFNSEQLNETLAVHDPEQAFRLGLTRLVSMEEIFTQWAKQDFAAAANSLTEIPPGARQEQAAYALLDQAMTNDPAAALAWFRALPDSVRASIGMFKLLNRYEQAPPEIYFTLLGEQLTNFGHTDGISTTLRAARQPNADSASLVELHKSLDGQVGPRLRTWAEKDSQGALNFARQYPDETLRPVLLGQWAQSMIHQGKSTEAESTLQTLPLALQEAVLKAAATP